jgi:hypothetical protein
MRYSRNCAAIALAICIGAVGARSASAQSTGNGFLFGPPSGTFTLQAGYAAAPARGDLIDFTTTNLTLNRGDFSSPAISAALAGWIEPRSQLQLSLGYAGTTRNSEFREYVDSATDAPITQSTTFQRVPISLSYKQYLTSPGRSIGSLAWIPAKLAPYLGVGGGAMWYRFKQSGDFVDFQTSEINEGLILVSSGWAPMAQAMAGLDYSLSPRWVLNAQGTYRWASAQLSNDFSGFGRLDLSGLSTTVGLSVRF